MNEIDMSIPNNENDNSTGSGNNKIPAQEEMHHAHDTAQPMIVDSPLLGFDYPPGTHQDDEMLASCRSSMGRRRRRDGDSILQNKVKKSVRFDPLTKIYDLDPSVEEIKPIWYTDDELAVFKKERRDFVKILKRVDYDLDVVRNAGYCTRGLEAYFSVQINKMTRKRRQLAVHSVLREQQRQVDEQILQGRRRFTPHNELLRQVSCQTTQWARERALHLGVEDAREGLMAAIVFDSDEEEEEEYENDDVDCCKKLDDEETCGTSRTADESVSMSSYDTCSMVSCGIRSQAELMQSSHSYDFQKPKTARLSDSFVTSEFVG